MNEDNTIYQLDDDDFDFVINKIEAFVTRIKNSRGSDTNAVRGLAYWQKLLSATYLRQD
ncbi:hypothetical protein QLQ12_06155 [Actinoplanes sp. NEAU-A12]|uniref:Uncharacterized protein n=1 Tax=Actinoplanes sandaracinus TaxID=3045177 RepID=A0ABT6WEP3_9ACTN|nr:hypothetical protein [Actinoplanes sandaracinus]MDI6098185.1 hypothetical protein [Actinoplanes sandaracinus]